MLGNENHSSKRARLNENDEGALRKNINKGSRLIICHAGCAKYSFISDAKWIFRVTTSKSKDYHTEVTVGSFNNWFQRLLSSLEEPSVIIMDSTSYNSHQIKKLPTSTSGLDDIYKWLNEYKIPHSNSEHKCELLQKIHQHKHEKSYLLDHLAKMNNHDVVRLPPYQCQYNPIELLWAKVKEELTFKDSSFEIDDVEKLLHEAIGRVSVENWRNCETLMMFLMKMTQITIIDGIY